MQISQLYNHHGVTSVFFRIGQQCRLAGIVVALLLFAYCYYNVSLDFSPVLLFNLSWSRPGVASLIPIAKVQEKALNAPFPTFQKAEVVLITLIVDKAH